MRIVFLDFDGVLNSWRHFKDAHSAGIALADPRQQIDRKAVRHLNDLTTKAGAKVVISSTWRILHPLEDLAAWLREAGFQGEVIGKTPDLSWRTNPESKLLASRERGHEIDAWLKEHPEVEAFVILDDGADMVMHAARLVQTTVQNGLKPRHVEAALALFASVQPPARPPDPAPLTPSGTE